MALNRLLLGIFALTLVCGNVTMAQFSPTESSQDGILILDAYGQLFSSNEKGIDAFRFKELEATSQRFQFPFPVAKDVKFVADPDGKVKGAYVLDTFGGQFALSLVSNPSTLTTPADLAKLNPDNSRLPYFGFDVAKDIEIAPDWRDVTYGYKGYFLLDGDGVVHSIGKNNLPFYIFSENGKDVVKQTLYPNTIDVSGSKVTAEQLLQGGPFKKAVNKPYVSNPDVNSVTPIFLYFGQGTDIARDLKVSVEWVTVTVPPEKSRTNTLETRNIAITNGYYIMDGFGGVHTNRLPLNINPVNDSLPGEVEVTYKDIEDPKFGVPLNNVPLSAPWDEKRGDLPYFGADCAVSFELTPSGNGFYLLDVYGAVFAVGDAKLSFPPRFENGTFVQTSGTTPFFGFPIARDLKVVTNKANDSLGLPQNRIPAGFLVIDGFGTVHTAGLANSFDISEKGNGGHSVSSIAPDFVGVESSPIWLPGMPTIKNFVIGSNLYSVEKVAPNYRNVSASDIPVK